MMINRDKMPIRILLDGRAFEFSNAELSGEDLKTEAGLRDDWTLFQITESGLIQVGTKERLRRPLWEKAIVDAEELLKTKRMSLLQRKAIEADIKRCRLATKSPTCDCRSRSPPSGDLRPRLVQGAGEGGLFDP